MPIKSLKKKMVSVMFKAKKGKCPNYIKLLDYYNVGISREEFIRANRKLTEEVQINSKSMKIAIL